jgi:hypothetical protein
MLARGRYIGALLLGSGRVLRYTQRLSIMFVLYGHDTPNYPFFLLLCLESSKHARDVGGEKLLRGYMMILVSRQDLFEAFPDRL